VSLVVPHELNLCAGFRSTAARPGKLLLLHVMPPHFVRIRHFGLVANRTRQDKLARCRQLLAVMAAAATSLLPPRSPRAPDRQCGAGLPGSVSHLRGRTATGPCGRGSPPRYPPMTPGGTCASLCLLSSPPMTTRSGRLIPVYPTAAPSSARPGRREILSAACGVFAPLSHAFLPRGGVLGGAATLGSSPQTR
jgi:hypothetical protein